MTTPPNEISSSDIMDRAVELLTAYLSNPTTHIKPDDIPDAYRRIRDVLKEDMAPSTTPGQNSAINQRPAVDPDKSIFADHLVCLECGGHFKTLKRHLEKHHNLSPEQYREKWNLPTDYPMVCEDYSKTRSDLAVRNGLGDLRRKDKKDK